jgi:hypothetical protein
MFKVDMFVVVVVLEERQTLLGLEFKVSLSVFVPGVETGLATGNEAGHGMRYCKSTSICLGDCGLPCVLSFKLIFRVLV